MSPQLLTQIGIERGWIKPPQLHPITNEKQRLAVRDCMRRWRANPDNRRMELDRRRFVKAVKRLRKNGQL